MSADREQPPGMHRVAVAGTGTMGSALAHALIAAGHHVTVWNRTRSRAEPLGRAGAVVADSLPAAIDDSEVVVMCVADQAAAAGLLSDPAVSGRLGGKVLAQLTTGTPADGRRNADWAYRLGIRYVDAAIMAYPREIGTSDAVIFYCGPAATDPVPQAVLQALGSIRFAGEDAGQAAVVDAALIAFFYGTMAGFLHAATLATAEGVTIGEFLEMSGPFFNRFIANAVAETGQRISTRDYSDPQSSMDTHYGGIDLLVVGSSQEAGIDTTVVTAIRDCFARALAAGHGGDDIACLVDVLRTPGSPGQARPEGGSIRA